MLLFRFSIAGLAVVCVAAQARAQGTFGQSRNLGGSVSSGQRTALSGTPGDRIAQEQQDAGQVTGGERFLRDNRQPGQFVGSDTGDLNNLFSQFGGAGGVGGELNNRAANANRNQTNRGSTGRTQRRPFRTTLRVGFEYKRVSPTELTAKLDRRLAKAITDRRLGEIEVSVAGRIAILTGAVPTPADRVLAERLVSLEAGISAVKNDLKVVPLPPPAEKPAEQPAEKPPADDDSPPSAD